MSRKKMGHFVSKKRAVFVGYFSEDFAPGMPAKNPRKKALGNLAGKCLGNLFEFRKSFRKKF
jgi:hypothetical protein